MQAQGRRDWALPEGFKIQFEGEQAELFIGGVYVRLFLKNPQFPLRHPKVKTFLCLVSNLNFTTFFTAISQCKKGCTAWLCKSLFAALSPALGIDCLSALQRLSCLT